MPVVRQFLRSAGERRPVLGCDEMNTVGRCEVVTLQDDIDLTVPTHALVLVKHLNLQ